MSVVTQLYFQIVEEKNYMFRSFSGWAIIRLKLEYRRKLIHYNVDIKNGGTRSRFTMFYNVSKTITSQTRLPSPQQPAMKPTQRRTDRPTPSKATFKDDSSPRVDKLTEDTIK
jgi:hypothetical protein